MPLISVIVPVYKVEPYLCRCVDSILTQTFADFELILVDDGSPDGCPAICDEYAEKDSRVHVIHQENGGLSAARNAGIDWAFANSDSEWLTFIDSDDWVHPEMLERLWKTAVENHVSLSLCGHVRTAGECPSIPQDQLVSQTMTPEECFVSRKISANIACAKLYIKGAFANTRYPVGKLHEDEFVTYRILFSCEKVAVIPAPLYRYFYNPEGITQSSWTLAHLDALEAHQNQIEFFEKNHFEKAKVRAAQALLWSLQTQISEADQQGVSVKDLRKRMRGEIRKYKKEIGLSPQKTCALYEAAYPEWMKLYWLWKALLKKLHLSNG